MKKWVEMMLIIFVIQGCITEPVNPLGEDEQLYEQTLNLEITKGCSAVIDGYTKIVEDFAWSSKLDNAQLHLGRCYGVLNEPEKAVQLLSSISKESSVYSMALVDASKIMLNDFSYYSIDDAINFLNEIQVKVDKSDKNNVLWNLSQAYFNKYEVSIPVDPSYFDTSIIYLESIISDTSIINLQESASYRIGWLNYQINNDVEAQKHFESYRSYYENGQYYEAAVYWEAKAYINMRDNCSAKKLFENYLKSFPYSDRVVQIQNEMNSNVCR